MPPIKKRATGRNPGGPKPTHAKELTALDGALQAARKGWRVYPQSRTKRPLFKDMLNKASSDAKIIRAWADQWSGCNWAVALGKRSGIVVVDIDPRNGSSNGLVANLPATLTVATGGGGTHLYYKYPADREIG